MNKTINQGDSVVRKTKMLRYSYNSKDVSKAFFQNKNFNKTESHNSRFIETKFQNTSLIGAKFKFCNLNKAVFDCCLIQGALFRKCKMVNAVFTDCIIISTNFERTSLKTCQIKKSIILSSPLGEGFKGENLVHSEIIKDYYSESDFSESLLQVVKSLKGNQFINRSSVLHRKKERLNTISMKLLVQEFGEKFLVKNLPILATIVVRDFYTLSYLTAILRKIAICDNFFKPGPLSIENT